ncbi:hypothetical protein CHCC20335_0579 [Bacillus paralicheniformis]|nr:hypothetical protein CHCC20335_0579 [Bacillus paralicheniformis]
MLGMLPLTLKGQTEDEHHLCSSSLAFIRIRNIFGRAGRN